ncbi:hypothetical protein DID88_000810 [Monilinia fructigena]|uniref:Wings apart-like protein C-terminal domain-containing protein n=1 Tax=Monilinia fructigena TaxID=38457 RepID=A0A395IKY4_9HELO|nr:hypothetical protein DID88_000810 [Monilinia fructigena]
MAAYENTVRPRKTITTYGKPSRKHLAGHTYGKLVHRATSSDLTKADLGANNESTSSNNERARKIYKPSPGQPSASRTQPAVDLYDVPLSDDEDPPLMRKNVTKSAQKVKAKSTMYDVPLGDDDAQPTMRKNVTKLLQKVPQKPTIYDVPLSEDDEPPSVKKNLSKGPPNATQQPAVVRKAKYSNSIDPANTKLVEMPERRSYQTCFRVNPKTRATSRGSQWQKNKTPEPQLPRSHASTDSEMGQRSATHPTRHISPKAARLWDALLDDSHETEETATTSADELSLVVSKPKKVYPMARKLSQIVAFTKPLSIAPRKRLIDSLVEQAPHQDSDEENDNDSEDEHNSSQVEDHFQHLNHLRAHSLTPEIPTITASQVSQGSQIAGPKFTYSRQRSMLVEEDMMEQLAFDMPLEVPQASHRRLDSIPPLKPLSSFREEEEGEDEAANTTIRTIHELRQAGANSRFADEVEDLLDRIGKPAAKTVIHATLRSFRSRHKNEGQGIWFLITSLIAPILAEGSVPLVVSQLQQHDIAKLLDRLISVEKSIVSMAKERKTNMSKMAQNSLSAYHDSLLKLPTWKDLSPRELSPRTLALKCLELMVRQIREAGDASDIISEELNTSLFEILKSSDGGASWDLSNGTEAINFYLTLSALESHSLVSRTAQDETAWIRQFLPVIGKTLNTALNRPLDSFGEQQILALKLTVNVTNHNPKACDAIASSDLMFTILRVIVAKFKNMSNLWAEEEIVVAVDNLILLIGAMINFALWSTKALKNIDNFAGTAKDPAGWIDSTICR